MGNCCCNNSFDTSPGAEFAQACYDRNWISARSLLLTGKNSITGRNVGTLNVNHVAFGRESILSTFLKMTDGSQLDILDHLLFPRFPHHQQPRCNVFAQYEPSLTNSPMSPMRQGTAMPFYLLVTSMKFFPSLAPYLQLLLEAAEMLPSPQNRNVFPSYWTNNGYMWNNNKETFIMKSVINPLLTFRPYDYESFRLILDANLIQNEDNLLELIFNLAGSSTDPAPVLRDILAGGNFPSCLRNENFSLSSVPVGYPKASLLFIAVANGNVEFVKELVANNVGGAITDGIVSNEDMDNDTEASSSSISKRYLEEANLSQPAATHAAGCVGINVLHVAAYAQLQSHNNSDETNKKFEEILTVLLSMPGSNEIKNVAAPMHYPFTNSMGHTFVQVTPAMLAVFMGHDSRAKILLANDGDRLPDSLNSKFSSFKKWMKGFQKPSILQM